MITVPRRNFRNPSDGRKHTTSDNGALKVSPTTGNSGKEQTCTRGDTSSQSLPQRHTWRKTNKVCANTARTWTVTRVATLRSPYSVSVGSPRVDYHPTPESIFHHKWTTLPPHVGTVPVASVSEVLPVPQPTRVPRTVPEEGEKHLRRYFGKDLRVLYSGNFF